MSTPAALNAFQHLAVIKAALEPLGWPVHLVFADQTASQYVVLSGPAWDSSDEQPLAGQDPLLDSDMRVKAVGGTPDGVAIMLAAIRAVLSPALAEQRFPMSGWVLAVRFTRSEFVDVDQSTTLPTSSRHPAFGVDTYRLISEPS